MLVASISDRSLASGIPFDQSVEEAQSALTAEFGLRRLAAGLETPEHPKVVIDALRPSLSVANLTNKYIELLENQPENIITMNLNRPISKLNWEQRREISDLGVSGQDEIILQFNQEKIRQRVHSLGGILDVTNLRDSTTLR